MATHLLLLSYRHDERDICTAHKATIDIFVGHLSHLLKKAVSIMVVLGSMIHLQSLYDYYHANAPHRYLNVPLFAKINQTHTIQKYANYNH